MPLLPDKCAKCPLKGGTFEKLVRERGTGRQISRLAVCAATRSEMPEIASTPETLEVLVHYTEACTYPIRVNPNINRVVAFVLPVLDIEPQTKPREAHIEARPKPPRRSTGRFFRKNK